MRKAGEEPKTSKGEIVGHIFGLCAFIFVIALSVPIFKQVEYNPAQWVFGKVKNPEEQHFIPMVKPEAYSQAKQENIKESKKVEVEQKTTAPIIENIPEKRSYGGMYQYTDKDGIISFTDNPANVPKNVDAQARSWAGSRKIEVRQGSGRETAIIAERDRVYVPVTIRSAGRSKEVLLLLDTGATSTTLYSQAAAGVSLANARHGRATLADGRVVGNITGEVEAVEVGPAVARGISISIMQQSGQKDHQGLLGMNFLKNFHYTLDLNRKVIRWN